MPARESRARGLKPLPLTDAVEILPNHTVVRPVYLMVVKDGKWVRLATV